VSTRQKWAAGIAVFYLIFWMGGNYSFNYTHTCARSHQEIQEVPDGQGDVNEKNVIVCDWYTANAKRWTFGDPARSVATTWIGTWTDAAIVGGIVAVIVGYCWNERRKARNRQAIYDALDALSGQSDLNY
jgi:hypothetical protein